MIFTLKQHLKAKLSLGRNPDFLVIGAAKCGTSSLMQYIDEYALDFAPPTFKEARYFSEFYHLPINYYQSNFSLFNKGTTGEATPDYLYYPKAPRLIKDYGKVSKFVVILRDPVKRAFSHYMFQNYVNKSEVSDPLTFSKAIRELNDRFFADDYIRFYSEYKHFSYIQRGYYYDQLKRWQSYFPPEQFHIMFLEELKDNFSSEMLRLFKFLDLKHNGKPFEQVIHNKSSFNEYPKLQPEDECFLQDVFRIPNQKLFDFLQKDPVW
jgi:hypothetical protein